MKQVSGYKNTYDRILLFLVRRRELGDDFALLEIVVVHSLVVSFSLAFFEPDIESTKVPF